MPITVTGMKDRPSTVTVSYNGETATVDYNKSGLNNREWREIRNRALRAGQTDRPLPDDADSADHDFRVSMLSRMITKWDVVEDAKSKKPYPTTKEALDELPPEFLTAVLNAITEDLFPKEPTEPPTGSFG